MWVCALEFSHHTYVSCILFGSKLVAMCQKSLNLKFKVSTHTDDDVAQDQTPKRWDNKQNTYLRGGWDLKCAQTLKPMTVGEIMPPRDANVTVANDTCRLLGHPACKWGHLEWKIEIVCALDSPLKWNASLADGALQTQSFESQGGIREEIIVWIWSGISHFSLYLQHPGREYVLWPCENGFEEFWEFV